MEICRQFTKHSHLGAQFVKTEVLLADKSVVAMRKTKRQMVLNKAGEKFIFRYDNGCEDRLLDALIEQAKDERTNFDWFDAAVLSFKLTKSLIGQANELLRGMEPDPSADAQIHAN